MLKEEFSKLTQDEKNLLLPDNLIILGGRGSHAHGTNIPSDDPNSIDDIDLMGIYVAPLRYYIGFPHKGEDVKVKFIGEWDVVSYEVRKYIQLLLNSNPNVMSLLWLPESEYLNITETGELLRDNRNIFVSKKAYHSFGGYAHDQLKKMLRYSPEIRDELTKRETVLRSNGIDFINDKPIRSAGLSTGILEQIQQYETLYSKYFGGFKGYKRKKLIEKNGYDTKDASHLIRLLRMGCEFIQTGEFQVMRPDAQELIDIKKGAWMLSEVQEEADRLFEVFRAFKERSTLPDEPDYETAEALCSKIITISHGLKNVN